MANNATLDDCQNSEYILYDVLEVIFRHLTVKSLRKVAQVSRSWNHAAKREISKRGAGPLFRVLLPTLYDTCNPKFNVGKYFVTKPNTVLMFCGPRPNMRPVLSLEYREYHERLPGRIVMLGVDHATMDAKEVRSCGVQSFCSSDLKEAASSTKIIYNKILGLCLPESEDFTITVSECVSHERNTLSKAKDIFEKLHESPIDDDKGNTAFLLFSRYDYTIGSHVLKMFKNKYAKKRINLWGGTINDFIKRSDDGYPDYRGTHGFLGIRLTGTRLNAHCLVLAIDDDDVAMSTKLSEFRQSFKLRRRSVGLACGPRNYGESMTYWYNDNDDEQATKRCYYPQGLMKIVKHEFPTIDFMGIFNDNDFFYYGCDHMSKNGDYNLQHTSALSIMILTYD